MARHFVPSEFAPPSSHDSSAQGKDIGVGPEGGLRDGLASGDNSRAPGRATVRAMDQSRHLPIARHRADRVLSRRAGPSRRLGDRAPRFEVAGCRRPSHGPLTMATFRRRGHWRTSSRGDVHWVSDHTVNREFRRAIELEIHISPRTSAWLTPNAKCPVCKVRVYFYSNDAGSRVYFDTLAPDWDKHPCTDKKPEWLLATRPTLRSATEADAYLAAAGAAGITLPSKPPFIPIMLTCVDHVPGGYLVEGNPFGMGDVYRERYLLTGASAPIAPTVGMIVFKLRRSKLARSISFFDEGSMSVVTYSAQPQRMEI